MSTGPVPIACKPDKYRLEQAKQEGREDFKAGGACLAPLKYQDEPTSIAAWLDGYLEAFNATRAPAAPRRARRLPLRDAWPKTLDRNRNEWLRQHWKVGAA